MKYTENYNLKKPDKEDFYNIEDFNDNADIIDVELKKLNDNKVDKIEGKGLSANDYTDEEKQKNQDNADNISDLQQELETHKAEKASLDNLGHVKHAVLTATLTADSWTGTTSPYSQSVTVSGIASTDTPIIDVVMSGTYSTDEARAEAWGYIYRAVTGNDSITFYTTEKPTINLPIQIKVVR